MTVWKLTGSFPVVIWSGAVAVSDCRIGPASGLPACRLIGALPGSGSGLLPWLGLGILAVAIAGLVLWWRQRQKGPIKASSPEPGADEVRWRRLFDQTPAQILEEDFTAFVGLFAELRAAGVTDFITYLAEHPGVPREWLERVRLVDANRAAVAAAGFANRQEMMAGFPRQASAPHLNVFTFQLSALWAGRRLFEQEIRYLDSGGHERACLVQCQVNDSGGQADLSRVVLALSDITTTKRAATAQLENQELLRQILSRADILLWWGQVRREDGVLRWRINVPSQSFDSPVFQLATAVDKGGLWDNEHVPEYREIGERAAQAILAGGAGYRHEFRLISPGGETHWLSEDVGIFRLGPDEWSLLGVVTDVTAKHLAEDARKTSEAQLQQILTRADCLLWRAKVVREGGGLQWRDFTMPGSVLCERLFGDNPPNTGTGLWLPTDTPALLEMNRRATESILSGASGYEQEFPVVRPDKTLWLHEQVSITPVGPDEWNLVGVLMDVTARHEAEEARKATEARLQQILSRADCMLWQAAVTEADGEIRWQFDIPDSALQRRLFGREGAVKTDRLYDDLPVPELTEMYSLGAKALHGGSPGYEHEFRVVRPDHTYWLHERASITREGPGRWRVVGVVTDVSALKEAEHIIRSSEARYRDLFEGAVEGVFQTTPAGRFIRVNPSLVRIFGCTTVEEFMTWTEKGAKSLYVKADRREEFFFELGASDGVNDFESEVCCRDGSIKWISENVRAVRDAGGRLLHLQGFLIDITERRKALAALQESEGRYRALFENIPVAIIEIDLRGLGRALQRWHAAGATDLAAHLAQHPEEFAGLADAVGVNAVNEAAVRLYQAESKEHFQREIYRIFTAEVLGVMRQWLESVWQGHNDGEAEAEFYDFTGGRHRTYLRWWMPRQTEWLRLEHAVVALVDFTELRRAEAALAAEKERLTVTLQAMAEGVITTDTRGMVQFMNRAAAELTRSDAALAVGHPIGEICVLRGQRSGQVFVLPLDLVIEERMLVEIPPQTRLVGRDGAGCLVEGCCAPVRDAESEVIGTVLLIRDVTVRQRFEEELERASRLESVGILAGGIAHDFNNILTAIMGNITLAMIEAGQLATVERNLQEAERATLRARDLTQQLLTFAKGGDPVRAAVLLPEIIREVSTFALHGSRVKCEFDLPPGLWPADADKGQLGRVVQNLVINAVQAMPEGGCIRIKAVNEAVTAEMQRPLSPGDYVHIAVADTGTGIKPEHLSKIFDPYFTTKQQGSGLGLTTVYSIIRKHQGHVEVESELGRGTTFHFWLPALRERQLEITENPAEGEVPLKGRVLFMDDEESILTMANLLLRRLGFEAELARDGIETVRKFAAAHAAGQPFDLVVMDLTVPGGIGGREAIEQLRAIDPGVRAIVSSGYSNDPVLANHRAYGFRGVVAKPYKIDDFTRVLRTVLRESRPPLAGVSAGNPAKDRVS